ncbi:MAG: pyrroline-5-carboxylate reductase [Clostridiales bacterium]|nr:pyrroline-5-carboxylate reductase [Clostridiales bacterium]
MRIGFIGAGNMGGAIIKGYIASGAIPADGAIPAGEAISAGGQDAIFVYDSDVGKASALTDAGLPVKTAGSLAQLAESCDTLVLCVKPNVMDAVLDELAEPGAGTGEAKGAGPLASGPDGKLVISIAAGISIGHIQEKLGTETRIVRVMPNTPAMVGEGMSAMSATSGLSEADKRAAERLFGAVGAATWVPEEFMDIVTGISGSSPAYAYLYMEGLIRAGIEGGLTKETATVLAAQSTLGAAKMVLENLGGADPQKLCDNVCSPGGTTIEAVKVLEAEDFIQIVSKAAQASAAKSKLMTR